MTTRALTVGPLTLSLTLDEAGALHRVDVPREVPESLDAAALAEAMRQLGEFPLALEGPAFHRKVWDRLRGIARGAAMTYAEIANALGSPAAVRAVGQACAKNRLLLIVPCHRVVASEGLGGFALGLDWKRKLLELESE